MVAPFSAGLGTADITAWEPGMLTLGWGDLRGGIDGVDVPLQARALVVSTPTTRLAIVTVDLCFVSELIRDEVLARLADQPELRLPDHALLLTATHTHSGPSGISHHALHDLGSPGIAPRVITAVADGVLEALLEANARSRPATLRYAERPVTPDEAHAYVRELRSHARHAAKNGAASQMASRVLRVDSADGQPLGLVSFFGLHGTCLHGENRRLHPDHSGLTARLLDATLGGDAPDDHPFVALCAQESAGDVTPNRVPDPVRGVTRGRTPDDFAHVEEVASAQATVIRACWQAASALPALSPVLAARLEHVDFAERSFRTLDGQQVQTTAPTLGAGMLLGTAEGRGPLAGLSLLYRGLMKVRRARRRGDPKLPLLDLRDAGNRPFFRAVPTRIARRMPAQAMAQYVRGQRAQREGWIWAPKSLPVQVLQLGSLRLAGVAAEPTLAAGHVIRQALLRSPGCTHAVSVGYSNGYASYVTTPEAYARQAYEGACTLYGPHTLALWCVEVARLSQQIDEGTPPAAPAPRSAPTLSDLADRSFEEPYYRPRGSYGLPRPLRRAEDRAGLRHYDTIVVGAGFAGLRVATRLQEAGQRVLVLEATGRVGGRALSEADGADLGCGFLATYHTHAQALVRELGFSLIDYCGPDAPRDPSFRRTTPEGIDDMRLSETFFQIQGCQNDGPLRERVDLLKIMVEWMMLEKLVDRARPWAGPLAARLDSITVQDWIDGLTGRPKHLDLVRLGVTGIWSDQPARLSMLYMLWYSACNGGMLKLCNDQAGGPQQYGVRGGLGGLVARFAETYRGALELSCPVSEVVRGARGFEVHCADGRRWSGTDVVMATPPHATGRHVRFDPPLPEDLRRFLKQPVGDAVKAIVDYPTRWWSDQPEGRVYQFFAGDAGALIGWTLDISEPSRGINRWCVFLRPPAGFRDVDQLKAQFAQELYELSGDPRSLDIRRFTVKDWRAEPYQGGGPVTVCGPGVLSRLRGFDRVAGLHFAGAEYSSSYPGYVEGALRSGEQVAAKILGRKCAAIPSRRGPQWGRFAAIATGYAHLGAVSSVLHRFTDPPLSEAG